MKIILASKSPRRRQLLKGLGLQFTAVSADTDEAVPDGITPSETVEGLAARKALAVRDDLAAEKARAVRDDLAAGKTRADGKEPCTGEDELIIAADTIVALDSKILGKPHSRVEAVEMLTALSGRTHTVLTGVALLCGTRLEISHEESRVKFAALSADDIARYVNTGEPMDKAGAYGIQDKGALLVESIDGDYFNVMGLPLRRLSVMLRGFGVDLFDSI